MPIDRRDFIVGSGLAAGALMMPISGTGAAQARMPVNPEKQLQGVYQTKVGSIKVSVLLDGPMQMDSSVVAAPDEAMLQSAKVGNFLPTDAPFPAYVNCYLVQAGGKNILIDTSGRGMTPLLGRMNAALRDLGIDNSSIDEIILTHAHPDHANGLIDETGKPAFSKAVLKICEDELKFWMDGTARGISENQRMMFDLAQKNLSPYRDSGQIQTFKAGADLGYGLSAVALPGHTPGHSGVRISDGSDQLLIWGDIVHMPFVQFAHPEQGMVFDVDGEAARATRQKIMDEVASDKIRVGGMHLIFPALGHLKKQNGGGYEFTPQHWEKDI